MFSIATSSSSGGKETSPAEPERLPTDLPILPRIWPEISQKLLESAQREPEQRVPGSNHHVLIAIHLIRDRPSHYLAAEIGLPEQRAVPRVERLEVPLASSGKQQIGRRRQDPAVGDVRHVEFP